MKLFALCLLFAAAAMPALAQNTLPAGSYPDPFDGMTPHRIILPHQPAAKPDAKPATGDALKGTPLVPYINDGPNDGLGLGKLPAPTPEPKEKSGPEIG